AKRNKDLTARPSGDLHLVPGWLGAEEAPTRTSFCKLDASQPMYIEVHQQSSHEDINTNTININRSCAATPPRPQGSPRSSTREWALEAASPETGVESPQWVRVLESCRYASL
ncbi:unnamed protein product, partial [Prorocentrum cordatum]